MTEPPREVPRSRALAAYNPMKYCLIDFLLRPTKGSLRSTWCKLALWAYHEDGTAGVPHPLTLRRCPLVLSLSHPGPGFRQRQGPLPISWPKTTISSSGRPISR